MNFKKENSMIDIEYEDLKFESLLEASEVKIRIDKSNFVQSIFLFINLMSMLESIKVVIFINLSTYFTYIEILELKNLVTSIGISIINYDLYDTLNEISDKTICFND